MQPSRLVNFTKMKCVVVEYYHGNLPNECLGKYCKIWYHSLGVINSVVPKEVGAAFREWTTQLAAMSVQLVHSRNASNNLLGTNAEQL